jgi:hypothetical protein
MNMLRHDDIAIHTKPEAKPDALERFLEGLFACVCQEQSVAPITAESNEVSLFRFVKALQAPGHVSEFKFSELPHSSPKQGLEWATRPLFEGLLPQGLKPTTFLRLTAWLKAMPLRSQQILEAQKAS